MAYSVPESLARTATRGERLVFQTLKDCLPDDYIVYYEPMIHGKRPDLVVIGPDLGVLVLEVKDYRTSTLVKINQETWYLYTSTGEMATVISPLKQAREYAFHLAKALGKDKNLLRFDGPYQGKLKFRYGFGTVFTRMTQKEFIQGNFYHVIDEQFVLTREQIDQEDADFSQQLLMEKIFAMFPVAQWNSEPLTSDDIASIRYHLFPEVRIGATLGEPVYYQDQLLLSLHDIKTMDLHQENLGKSLGDRHRLIRGVAGSGKTIVLVSRVKQLAKEHPDWSILVLCFGITLSARLDQMIHAACVLPEENLGSNNGKESQAQITVSNFHHWLTSHLKTPIERLAELLEKIERKEAIIPTYDAVLIDEGQDFEPEWLKLITRVLNPSTQSLLLVEDRAQNIFRRKTSFAQDIGLDFRGRSRVLSINYRNTRQILDLAWDFYRSLSDLQEKVVEGSMEGVEIISPQASRRQGHVPILRRFAVYEEEVHFVAKAIEKLHQQYKVPFSQMVILYRVKGTSQFPSYVEPIQSVFKKRGIPYYWVTESPQTKRNFRMQEESIKICTLDSAKGLDFQAVFIVNVDSMPFYLEKNQDRETALLYIGMTRALDWLFLTYTGQSIFTDFLDQYREKIDKKKMINSRRLDQNEGDGYGGFLAFNTRLIVFRITF